MRTAVASRSVRANSFTRVMRSWLESRAASASAAVRESSVVFMASYTMRVSEVAESPLAGNTRVLPLRGRRCDQRAGWAILACVKGLRRAARFAWAFASQKSSITHVGQLYWVQTRLVPSAYPAAPEGKEQEDGDVRDQTDARQRPSQDREHQRRDCDVDCRRLPPGSGQNSCDGCNHEGECTQQPEDPDDADTRLTDVDRPAEQGGRTPS